DTEGYFVPHELEVTTALAEREEHSLTVEVACPTPRDLTAKRNLTGAFQHGHNMDPQWNPGGIWRPVRVERTGPVRIRKLRVLCREANERQAVLAIRAELDSSEARTVALRTVVGDITDHEQDHPLARGSNRVEWTVTVDHPPLWWPWSLGEQPLVDVSIQVDVDGARSHTIDRRVGFRSVSLRNWICSINGERLFLKGSNAGPTRMALADASPEDLVQDVNLARDAGLDFLRLHAHITRPEFYAAADEAGLLLWQDMPLQWGYARTVRKQAQQQARAAVDLLGHHPSIFLWCGHNEPFAIDALAASGPRFVRDQQLPTWNKTVLDRTIRRAIGRADGSRPVIAHSGVLPHAPKLDGTDTHVWFGWHKGDERDFSGFCRAIPRLARFVSEFGAQSVPDSAEFMQPEHWPNLNWAELAERYGYQGERFAERVSPEAYASFEEWREATQIYQAELIRRHIETLRRLKYRPTGGFSQFMFADGRPGVGFSVLDHDRVAKLGYQALVDACRAVIVVADRLPAALTPGAALALDVHVVSDRRHVIPEATVTARASWSGGAQAWAWRGSLPADSCTRVGTVAIVVPKARGRFQLDLDVVAGDSAASNRYEAVLTAP
ncbi:MAG: putative glycosidase, partial [Acidimicrobiia bacterium]|nr:putative glycosidase [Acidimicrobiia bacterium]